ncbi:MAG TPA: sarcosine oxidase subunit gamma family protein [Bauldia sp.]|nr:sarcosine oxidase subunit gamma family protein [Bauldia sp.]
MSDRLAARSALHGFAVPGRHGRMDGAAGVTVGERVDLGLASVMARKGQGTALREIARAAYGADLPDTPRHVAGPEVGFIGTGPGQWLAVSERLANGDLSTDLSTKLKGLASISDQSDGRAVVRFAGGRAREVLAKGLPIDLHPSLFAPGGAATSIIALMGVTLWQVDAVPTYDIAVFRSLAGSFWKWLTDSAAEFGYDVAPTR